MMRSRSNLTFWFIDALFLTVTIAPGLAFLVHILDLMVNHAWVVKSGVFEHLDFVSFYSCGKMVLNGQGHEVYDAAKQLAAYNEAISPQVVPHTNFLQHLPFVFVFLPLIAIFPLRASYLTFGALSAVYALVGTAVIRLDLHRRLLPWQLIEIAILFTAILSSFSGSYCLFDGQISFFYFLVLALFSRALITNNAGLTGISLAILLIKPQYFLFMLIPVVALKRGRALIFAGATLCLLLILSILVLGWENVLHYPQILLHGESAQSFGLERPRTMVSVRGVLTWFLPNKTALLCCFASAAVGLLVCARMWWRRNISVKEALAFSQLMMLIVSPHCYVYESLLVSVPILLLLPSVRLTECLRANRDRVRIWRRDFWLLSLLFPLAYNISFVCAAPLARTVLPSAMLEATKENGVGGGLFIFFGVFAYNLLLLITLAMSGVVSSDSNDSEPDKTVSNA